MEACILELSEQESLDHKIALNHKNIRSFNILVRDRVPSEREKGYQDVMERLGRLLNQVLQSVNMDGSLLSSIGVGLPGSVDPKTEKMIFGNSAIFEGQNVKDDLANMLGIQNQITEKTIRITINNDANCFALAEFLGGAGLNYQKEFDIPFHQQIAIGIILGTGVGGGIILKGEILTGKGGGGGEIGHTNLHPGGKLCYCKQQGCAELYLSGTGIESGYKDHLNSSDNRFNGLQKPKSSREIFASLEHGDDPIATLLIDQYIADLSRFIANLNNIFDPHYFVLGGGVSNQDHIYRNLETSLKTHGFLKNHTAKIYKHKLGDSAGVIGAAALPYI